MRRALELVLLLSGALALALGIDQHHAPGWPMMALAASGGALLVLGIGLSLWPGAKRAAHGVRPAPVPAGGPLGAATLAFAGNAPPRIVSRDGDLDVAVDGDGTVRFRLAAGKQAGRLVCRAGSTYFNTLRQDRREAAIKLIGPMPPLVRLELWDAALKDSA